MTHKNSDQPKFGEKICYGFGDLASVLYWQTFMLYLPFFYTDVFGISAAAAASLFLYTRIWDGLNDPIMGMIADRTKTRWGKFRPYLLWMCVPLAIAGIFAFTTPDLGPTGKLLYAYVTFIIMMMLFTAINIPYTAMLGVISDDSLIRTTVSSIKFLFAFTAGIMVSAFWLPLTKALGDGTKENPAGWQMTAIIVGVLAVGFFLITFRGTKERVEPPTHQRSSIGKDLFELVTNGPWLILLATTMSFILFIAIRSSVTIHYFKYVVGTQEANLPFLGTRLYEFEWTASAFNTLGQAGALIGVLLVSFIAKIIGKRLAFIILLVLSIVLTALFYIVDPNNLLLLLLLNFFGSLTGGPLSVLLWAMYADTADYGEWKRGSRSTGLVFSASTMSQKFGWAIGAYIALTLMSQVGFTANVEQSEEGIRGLLLLFSLIPAGIGIISVFLFLFYPLHDKRMEQISADLKARRVDGV